MFTTQFDSYVCTGDEISCTVGPFEITARVVHDDSSDPREYDESGCCFDTSDPEHGKESQAIIDSWLNDEWSYIGVVLSVTHVGSDVLLTDHGAALWGIECNFMGKGNEYLMTVANELLSKAIDEANQLLSKLKV